MIDIVAININNLTDARYFAARGASWIFYLLGSEQDIPRIKEICSWIDGPKLGLSFVRNVDESLIHFATDILKPEGIILEGELFKEGIKNFFITDNPHLDIPGKEKISLIPKLDSNYTGQWIYPTIIDSAVIDQIEECNPGTVVFSGTEENQTGIKDYDDYDKILDVIDRINYP